jgi:ABC-type uncharacterized transport system permease subunit
MINAQALAAVIGGIILAIASLLYAGNSLVYLSGDTAVSGMAVVILAAFFGLTVYEDWKDAKQARETAKRS